MIITLELSEYPVEFSVEVARNANTSKKALSKLAEDEDCDVRAAVVERES